MKIDETKNTKVFKGSLKVGDDEAIPVEVKIETSLVRFQIHSRVVVDFGRLRQSGELDSDDLDTLERGYSDSPVLFIGMLPGGGLEGKDFCLGILTDDYVYPKNMFFLTLATALGCCTPSGEEPRKVKPL